MFSEVLRIKPVLDPATTKKMELTLSQRFAKVSKGFGKGLMAVVKGSIIGISVGLLSKLLNPLENLEEKIKTLLNQGKDLRELAEGFGSNTGDLKRLIDIGGVMGIDQNQIVDTIQKFQDSLKSAQKEIDSGEQLSPQAAAVKEFVGEKNIVTAFTKFITGLQRVEAGQGRTYQLPNGQMRTETGAETRDFIEEQVFGNAFTGAMAKLFGSDLDAIAAKSGVRSSDELGKAVDKLYNLEVKRRALETVNQSNDMIRAAGMMNGGMIASMEARAAKAADMETRQLKSFDDLSRAADAVQEMINLFKVAMDKVNVAIAKLSDTVGKIVRWVENNPYLKKFLRE